MRVSRRAVGGADETGLSTTHLPGDGEGDAVVELTELQDLVVRAGFLLLELRLSGGGP